jgi:cytidyltransferase-related domain
MNLFNLPEISRKNAIIYFNGSFDPAHKGHLSSVEAAIEKTQAVGAVVVVCEGENSNKPNRSSWEVRRQTALKVFGNSDKIVVSPWGKEITKKYLLERAYVIKLIGADIWETYSKRTEIDFHAVCISLPNGEKPEDYTTNLTSKEVVYIKPDIQGCFSSKIRDYLKLHPELYEGAKPLPNKVLNNLPPSGLKYIIDNKLYYRSKEASSLQITAAKTNSVFSHIIPLIGTITKAMNVTFFNSLEDKLAEKLDDIERARVLLGFYTKIQKHLSNEDQHLFEDWLIKHCHVLSSIVSKEERLLEDLNSAAFQSNSFKTQIKEFLSGIDGELPMQQNSKRVAILYTGLGGGGHKAPANAIREKLISENYSVEMIDTDEVEREFEPKIFGRGHEDIWTEIYQRRGQPVLANFMWKLHHWLYLSAWRKTTQVVRNKLKEFNPDLIFTVADHKPQFACLAYSLNKKMIFVHTDNKFSSKLKEIAQIQSIFKNTLVKFTKPSTAEPISYEKTLPKISGIKEQIIELQIPVRKGFNQISIADQNELKKKWALIHQ